MNAKTGRSFSLFDDFFPDFSPGFFIRPLHGDALPTPAQIKVDVRESDNYYDVIAEVPGVKKEDIQISLDGNVVTLRAEVKQEDRDNANQKFLRTERFYGAVSRSFQLPQDIDVPAAKAKYENGLLRLTLPKKSGSRMQTLAIE
jgi:HSP20 family protein